MKFVVLFLCCFSLCNASIADMSVEQKVGQLLMVHFLGEEINDDAKLLIQQAHVGGFVFFKFANGLTSPEQVRNLTQGLQNLSRIPLLIAIDQEGGPITHLKNGFTYFPSNWAVGRTQKPEFAERMALYLGQELSAVGINMNLAPVVDVNTNPANPVIGIRSFGSLPNEVALFGGRALKGYKEARVIATLKHFPGHGDVAVDSHKGLPVSNHSLADFEKVELYPFAKLASDAEVIMTAHLLVPAIDPDNCASFSEKLLEGVLRKKLGFNGVIISDSLLMDGALLQASSLENAAIKAFNAGCDLLTVAGGFSKSSLGSASSILSVHKALVEAVKDGRITHERLNASLGRILKLKSSYPLVTSHNINNFLHAKFVQEIASQSAECLYNHGCSLSGKKIAIIAPDTLTYEIANMQIAAKADLFAYYKLSEPSHEQIEQVLKAADAADVIIALSANAWKFPKQLELFKKLEHYKNKVCLICLGSSQDASIFPNFAAAAASYGPAPLSLDAALQSLLNK